MHVKNHSVEDGEPQDGSNELKLNGGLEGVPAEPIESLVLIVREHGVLRGEEISAENLEELFLNTTFIHSGFALKEDLQRLSQMVLSIDERVQGVLNNVRAVHLHH